MTASRLAAAQSAYLRSAAHQPVEWHPWGPEPFARARAEGKPVLLDIGAVWCHWCHVMDAESYEDPRVAEVLNRDWICIKVDRDELPDVDARYQRAVQVFSGQGGWPLTAFLTPDGEVFYGGTYFSPEGQHGTPGLLAVLGELSRVFQQQPDRVADQAAEIRKHLAAAATEGRHGTISRDVLSHAADLMAHVFDFRYGGFGVQPKFPHPGACTYLLARGHDTGDRWPVDIAHRTLTAMARGGVYDQIGGGFHRYSVDARWVVPHFEKMTCDNAELLSAYVQAAAALEADDGRDPTGTEASGDGTLYRQIVAGTVGWVEQVLAVREGGYGGSQDADVGADDDGDYFTWTPEEVRAVVTAEEFEVLTRHYDIDEVGDMHGRPGRNVLWVRQSPQEVAVATGRDVPEVERQLAAGRLKLKAARDQRPSPVVDRAVYAGWTAMMAAALLDAAVLLDRPDIEQHALLSLERLFREGADGTGERGVAHALEGEAIRLLEDQAQLATAALDAYEATGGQGWLARAGALGEYIWSEFRAPDGGLFDTPVGGSGAGFLAQRLKPIHDAPTPSGNAVAALAFLRLAEHTGDARWRERARVVLEAFGGELGELSLHGATALKAADWYLQPVAHLAVVGSAEDPEAERLARAVRRVYHPRKVVTRVTTTEPPESLPAAVRAMLDGRRPRAYICVGTRCGPPVDRAEDVLAALAELSSI